MVGQVLKVHLISRIFDYSFQLEYSKEVSTVGIIPSQLVLPETTFAHPPSDMELEYDIGKQTLVVSIIHSVSKPDSHYVEKIEIKKNGNLYLTEEYTNQPSTSTFTYTYDEYKKVLDTFEMDFYKILKEAYPGHGNRKVSLAYAAIFGW